MYSPQSPVLVAARADEALTHGQVLYGLIKPTKDMTQIESTAAMVNVIPKKRIYVMEEVEELELFSKELFKRPLVVQPSAFIGRGLAAISCTMFTKEEKWIVLINQSHPKIYGRIRMVVDLAKSKFERGEPFIIELSFNNFLKKVYLDRMTKAPLDPRFTFIDFEDAKIVIRSRGAARFRGLKHEFKNPPIKFEFEDLLPDELVRRTVSTAQHEHRSPALRVIKPAEMERYLPGWSFEQIDPLEAAVADPPPEYEEAEGATAGGDDLPDYNELCLDEGKPQGRIVGRAQRKAAAAGAKYSVPVELHVPEPEGPQVLHTGHMFPSPTTPYGSRSPNEHYGSSPSGITETHHSGNSRGMYVDQNRTYQYNDYNSRQGHRSVSKSPDQTYSPTEEYGVHRQNEPYSRDMNSPRTPNGPNRTPDNYRQYPISPFVKEMKQPAKSTYLTDDNDDDEGGFSPSDRSRTPQTHSTNYANSNNYRNFPQTERVSPSPRNETLRFDRDMERISPSPRGQGPSSGRPVAPPRSFHRYQGSGRSESGSDSGFGESDNHIHTPSRIPYYNHAFEKDSPEMEQSMDDILAQHKALAAKMLQQHGQGQYKSRQDGPDDYNRELQKWRQNINNLEDACHGPVVDFSRSRSQMSSQGQEEMGESVI